MARMTLLIGSTLAMKAQLLCRLLLELTTSNLLSRERASPFTPPLKNYTPG